MVKTILDQRKKVWLTSLVVIGSLAYIALQPHQFIDLWLSKDQQGQLLFNLGHYQQANSTFTNNRWQAFSAYGNEDYDKAATLYSQFNDAPSLLAQANALAHGRRYIKARNLYQDIISHYPDFSGAKTNLNIVQEIIDAGNLLSKSQQDEGESSKELGDEPQTGDGAERENGKEVKKEQLSSEQLLLDDNLNQMWLRQVQKDPGRFLAQKFYMQLEKKDSQSVTEHKVDDLGGKDE